MTETIQVSAVIPASVERIYKAWLSSKEHGAFTGGSAEVDPRVDGEFTAWDGYIQGKTIELEPYSRIAQTWRTSDFPSGSADSRLEVLLEKAKGGTKITLVHTNIPDGQGKNYQQGWLEYYFEPMKKYFKPG
ncbi:MAG: SRPBCC domain-containing protein [Chloroflexi bacterium]|nr:SRPBCC domain-containing protein [Chloroflexota bacterium]